MQDIENYDNTNIDLDIDEGSFMNIKSNKSSMFINYFCNL